MRNFLVLVIMLLGCADDNVSNVSKIEDWQSREAQCQPIAADIEPSGRLYFDLGAIQMKMPKWTFVEDHGDDEYFKASCESMNDPVGDCEDMAILFYRTLVNSTLVVYYDLDVRIRIIDVDAPRDHVVVVLRNAKQDYEIDNFIVKNVVSDDPIVKEFDMHTIY